MYINATPKNFYINSKMFLDVDTGITSSAYSAWVTLYSISIKKTAVQNSRVEARQVSYNTSSSNSVWYNTQSFSTTKTPYIILKNYFLHNVK
jgi:hypothetical protein